MNGSLQGKVALITGSGRGIGAACAHLFASEGAKVVIASRTQKELDKVEEQIRQKFKSEVLSVCTNIIQEANIKLLFNKIKEKFGKLDILINNAAVISEDNFADLDADTWDNVMDVNLRAAFLCSREAFKMFNGRGGAIVNVSSLGGIQGSEKFKGFTAYIVSKFGIVGLTESLAVEGKESGIRVNCIAPGAVNTQMLKNAAPHLKSNTYPEDIAKTVLFLCDENQSKAINGSIIEIHSNL